jgi:acyl carrier protein
MQTGKTFVGPRTQIEEIVADIWAQLFRIKQVSTHDNFFELGGHSLLAAQLVFRLNEIFQVELPVRRLFEVPTVAGLVRSIIERQSEQLDSEKMSQILADIEQLSEEEAQWMLVSH